jgi:hypothetical protein
MVANIFNIIFVMSPMSHLDPDGRKVRRGLGMAKHQRNYESRQGSRDQVEERRTLPMLDAV